MRTFEVFTAEKGITLVLLIIIVILVGISAVGLVAFLSQNIALSAAEKDRARALYLAEMGVADSFWELKYSEKLYGSPSQPYGQIDLQTVNFGDGTSGTYSVPEPDDSIVSTGTYRGITRQVKVGIDYDVTNYAFFAASASDFTFDKNCQVTGNCFINGSVTVKTPTNMDTLQMTLYLPTGESATYSGGSPFPYTTVDPAPTLSDLDLTYYDDLLNLAASQPAGDSTWSSDRSLPDTVLINGDLEIKKNKNITTAGDSTLVVVNGSITVGKNVDIGDNVRFIAQSDIDFNQGITVGTTTGRSGNLLFVKQGELKLGKNNTINGSVISNQKLKVKQGTEVNGFVYAGTETNMERNATINGCLWGHSFKNQKIQLGSSILWNSGYIPASLPPGVSSIGSSSVSFVQNSWREL